MARRVCVTGYIIKDPMPLVEKRRAAASCPGGKFPFSI